MPFPMHIYLQETSPDKGTNAIIYSWSHDNDAFLGSDDRFILGFSKGDTKWYIEKELSEGFGTYEGGIIGLKWINNQEVLIKRIISDSPNDIKYNTVLNKWILVNTKEN